MAEDQSGASTRTHAVVKWFDATRGFGFLVADGGGPDVLLHANVLRNYGWNSISEQARVEVMVVDTERGLQATEILSIEVPKEVSPGALFIPGLAESPGDLPLEPGRIKWFDRAKGFGFANIFGRADDVFVHVQVLRRGGMSEVQPGEAVGLRVAEGPRGPVAVEITGWDAALATE